MSIRVMDRVFDLDLDPKDKIVLLVLADHADVDGYCYPGQETLARRSSIPVRTLRRILGRLEEDGFIVRERRVSESGHRKTDGYSLAAILAGGAEPTGQNEGAYRPAVAGTKEPSVEPSGNTPPTPSAEAEAFAKAWEAWPRKEGKQAAIKAWRRAVREHHQAAARGEVTGAPIDAVGWDAHVLLVDTVFRFGAAHARNTPPRFVPHLATWLNQQRWTDPLPVGEDRGARTPEPPRRGGIVIPQGHVPVRDEMGHIIGSEPAS